ncbi:L,D-transpeptidase [Roseibium aestuarii]|uniref:L,D-transpeptidase n=1 Tax=Roseibium aestuarii TaxID=2600299 RepID=A0ABW4K2R2_9HYPH|nr:L,D-transpeptidase [Roseibium aestuarii]
MSVTLTRRRFLTGLMAGAGAGLAGCQPSARGVYGAPQPAYLVEEVPDYGAIYGARLDGGYSLPPVDYLDFDPTLWRQRVHYPVGPAPGTVVVDPAAKFLYVVEPGGRAVRYGISVGRAGYSWQGEAVVGAKQVWPKWFPPAEMIARDPDLEIFRKGQEGGPTNPLGARALYLWQGGRDTLYRIHGTNQPKSIGWDASSGCIRLWQQDIIDLYDRVPMGARVIVLSA